MHWKENLPVWRQKNCASSHKQFRLVRNIRKRWPQKRLLNRKNLRPRSNLTNIVSKSFRSINNQLIHIWTSSMSASESQTHGIYTQAERQVLIIRFRSIIIRLTLVIRERNLARLASKLPWAREIEVHWHWHFFLPRWTRIPISETRSSSWTTLHKPRSFSAHLHTTIDPPTCAFG